MTNAAAWIPGGNLEQMYYNLTQKLMALAHDMILFRVTITHRSSTATMGEQKKTKPYLKFPSFKQFPAATGYR